MKLSLPECIVYSLQTEAKTNVVFEQKLAMRSHDAHAKEQVEIGVQSQAQSDDQINKNKKIVLQTPRPGHLSLAESSCAATLRVNVRHSQSDVLTRQACGEQRLLPLHMKKYHTSVGGPVQG